MKKNGKTRGTDGGRQKILSGWKLLFRQECRGSGQRIGIHRHNAEGESSEKEKKQRRNPGKMKEKAAAAQNRADADGRLCPDDGDYAGVPFMENNRFCTGQRCF